MSRIGKRIIEITNGATLDYNKDTKIVIAKGPLGELSLVLPAFITLKQEGVQATLEIEKVEDKKQKSSWGTYNALVANMVTGVTKGFTREMELNGVGFKMEISGNNLTLALGFSHPVKLIVPAAIKISIDKNIIKGVSNDNQLLGDFMMNIHNMKPCDVYKQKGFKIPGRFYRKKVGKKAK
jgi:large subunit ribosomal protein L6